MDVDRLFHHPFIARHTAGPVRKRHLINHYFDTPGQILRQHEMALRIRFDGSAYVQTLKRKGTGRDGLTVRGEWEWEVGGPNIEPQHVPFDLWPSALGNCLNRLVPLFRTDFLRTVWPLQFSFENRSDVKKPARVEMSLDQGVVAVDDDHGAAGEEPILEVEFELQEGDTDALFEISRRLGEEIRLVPGNISKAERGYRLLDSV